MKCLEKDRNRRYETASGLARDVERYIGGDAVEACPPTLGYRLRKFYGRNRAAAWIAGLFLGLTYAGASGIYFGYQRAVRAERRLGYERDAALASEERAIAATREAARERDKVADVNASLRSLADRQRRTLYASSMNLAQAAWEAGDARRTLELLRQWVPKPGANDLRGFEWHYWNRQAHQEARSVRLQGLTPPEATGLVAAVSRDGTRVAGAISDLARYTSTIRVWNAANGQELWRSPPFPGVLESCSFSDNGQRLLTNHSVRGAGTNSAEARVWAVNDGTRVYTSPPLVSTEAVFILAFLSADGERLATEVRETQGNTSKQSAIRVVRVSDGKELAQMSVGRRSESRGPLFVGGSPDLAKVLICENSLGPLEYQVRLHDVQGGQRRWAVNLGVNEFPRDAWFVPGGERLLVRFERVASGKWKSFVIVLDVRDGRKLATHLLPDHLMIQRFGAQTITPSGSRFAVMLNRSVVVCKLDGPAGDESESLASFAHESNIAGISLVADGSRLITLDQLGVVREWDLTPPPRMVHAFDRVRFNADGSRRFYYPRYSAATTTIPLRIVDRSEREVGDRLAPLSAGHAHGPAASADGRTQAITWHPNQGECLLVAWDLATGRERCRVKLGPGIWEELAVSPDGERAALLGSPPEMAGKPRTPQFARIMDLNTGKVVWSSETQGTSRYLHGVEFDPSGRHLVISQGRDTTSDDWAIVWYDAATMAEAARIAVGSQNVTVAAFSRDGRFVAVREQSRFGYAWSTENVRVFPVAPILRGETPAPLFQLTGSSGQFGNVAFSPDGSRLMASGDRMLRLWETTNGAEVLTIPLKNAVNRFNWCFFSCRRPSDLGRARRKRPALGMGRDTARKRGGRTMSDVTQLLEAANRGDRQAAADLLPMVYDELRKLAAARLAREKPGQTLDATSLVHEAFLRLVGEQTFDGQRHFFAAAAEAIRRILVEQARRRQAMKRGGDGNRQELDPDRFAAPAPDDELLALHEALDRFAEAHPEKAELVKLRYFAGLTADQAAEALEHLAEHRRPPLGLRPSLAPPRHVFPWRRALSGCGSHARSAIIVIMNDTTRLLSEIEKGDRIAAGQLLPLVYEELRKLAAQKLARENPGQTLQATALVHEAYLRLVGPADDQRWQNRGHFFAAAAEAMRRILVENARRKNRLRHGGGLRREEIGPRGPSGGRRTRPTTIIAVHESLDKLAGRRCAGRRTGQAALFCRPDDRAGRGRTRRVGAQGVHHLVLRSGLAVSLPGRRSSATRD